MKTGLLTAFKYFQYFGYQHNLKCNFCLFKTEPGPEPYFDLNVTHASSLEEQRIPCTVGNEKPSFWHIPAFPYSSSINFDYPDRRKAEKKHSGKIIFLFFYLSVNTMVKDNVAVYQYFFHERQK